MWIDIEASRPFLNVATVGRLNLLIYLATLAKGLRMTTALALQEKLEGDGRTYDSLAQIDYT